MAKKANEHVIKLSKKAEDLLAHGHTEDSSAVKDIRRRISNVEKNKTAAERRIRLKQSKTNPQDYLKEITDTNEVASDPTRGFDEFGVIIFKDNKESIVVGLPDFDEKLIIEKSNKISYEDLIIDTVFKAAVNQVRENRSEFANIETEKDILTIGLTRAHPITSYQGIPFAFDIEGLDKKLSDIQPPAYCFISINVEDVCEQASNIVQPMAYKPSVKPFQEEGETLTVDAILNADNTRQLFSSELDTLMDNIQKSGSNNFTESLIV